MVTVATLFDPSMAVPLGLVSVTVKLSALSPSVSFVIGMVTVAVVALALKLRVPLLAV
jgi:hypothetical protein